MRGGKVRYRRNGRQERRGQASYIFCGLLFLVVGAGSGIAAAADGYVAGVAVTLINIPIAGLCLSEALLD